MTLNPYTVDQFGALRLDVDPTELGAAGATSLSNVDFDRLGRIRPRFGNTQIFTFGGAVQAIWRPGIAVYNSDMLQPPQFIIAYRITAGGVRKLAAINTAGASVSTINASVNDSLRTVQWGDPTANYMYIASSTGTYRWDGAAFTQPAGIGASQYIGVVPNTNRLVITDPTLTSKVKFSGAGTPEVFGANDFVQLSPGDGSTITGIATWRDNVYVFKGGRYFVFTAESVDSAGNPVFNYRTVDRFGSLAHPVSGDEGVYFYDGRSIWVTAGLATPVRISRPIEPYLAGLVSLNGTTAAQTFASFTQLFYSGGRLWVSVPTSGQPTTLVYDPKTDTWTTYSMTVNGVAEGYDSGKQSTYWITSDITNMNFYKFDPTVTTDNGSAIAWSYTSGLYDAGSRDRKAVNWTDVVGSGTVTLTVGAQDAAPNRVADAGSSVVLGTAPALATTRRRRAVSGRFFQHTLSGSGAAVVAGLTHYFPSGRQT